jgi:type I restriction enzyme M protein
LGKTEPDPLRGLFEVTAGGKRAVLEYEPDPDLRVTEQVPLLESGGIGAFLRREVLPHAADAWYAPDSVRTGYEVSFTRHFLNPRRSVRWKRFEQTSWLWKRRPRGC